MAERSLVAMVDSWWSSIRYRNAVKWHRLEYLRRQSFKALDNNEFFEYDEIEETIRDIEGRVWLQRAANVGISLSDVPKPEGEEHHWERGKFTHGQVLHHQTVNMLRRLVEDRAHELTKRRREGHDLFIKWGTFVGASIAALASLYLTQRGPK